MKKRDVVILLFIILLTVFVYAANNLPVISGVYLNSTLGTYTLDSNLTVNWTVTDADGNFTKNITVWYLNNQSIQLLNMPFEGGSNATYAKDYSGHNNYADVLGPDWCSNCGYDSFGAFQFKGEIQETPYVPDNITINNKITAINEFSISLWFKAVGPGGNITDNSLRDWGTLIAYNWSGGNGEFGGLYWKYSENKTEYWGENTAWLDSGYNSAPRNQWNNLVYVYGEGKGQLYLNGIKKGLSKYYNNNLSNILAIGSSVNTGGDQSPFNGTIDDIIIWNRSLSDEEVKFIFENKSQYILSSQELNEYDYWYANITANDGVNDSISINSTPVVIGLYNGILIRSFNFTNLIANWTLKRDTDVNVTFNVTFISTSSQHNVSILFYNDSGTNFVTEVNFTGITSGSLGSYFFNKSNYTAGNSIVFELKVWNNSMSCPECYRFANISAYIASNRVIIPNGGGDYQNLTACLMDLNNTKGESCTFNYTSGTNSTTFTLPYTYFNITKSTDYVLRISLSDATILINNTNNITIDCNNSIINGINGTGIWIQNSSNITLKNCYMENYPVSLIWINDSYNITLDNINLYNDSYTGLYMENTNNSFIRNINASSLKQGYLVAAGYSRFYPIYLSNSQHNIFNNLTLLGEGYIGLANAAGTTAIYLGSNSSFNNFTNSTITKFNFEAAVHIGEDTEIKNVFNNITFESNSYVLSQNFGNFNSQNVINKSLFIRNNAIYQEGITWGINISESKFINNIRDTDQILIKINNTANKTTGEFVTFNITFRSSTNLGEITPTNYNISVYPLPSNLQYHQSSQFIFGNFTVERSGMYSIVANMTDERNNVIKMINHLYTNTTVTNITYYIAANRTMSYGQFNVIGPFSGAGGSTDAVGMTLNVPEVEGMVYCTHWIAATVDEIPRIIFGIFTDYDFNLWVNQTGTGDNTNVEIKRYAGYTGGANPEKDRIGPSIKGHDGLSDHAVWFNHTSISNYLIPMNYQMDWVWFQMLIEDDFSFVSGNTRDPHIFTGPTYPSYMNITYLYSKPIITNITNLDTRIYSATLTNDNSNNATIQLEGENPTEITIEMPNPAMSYKSYYDGTLCSETYSNCNYTASANVITLNVTLGSLHNIGIEPSTTSVEIDPSNNFDMRLRETKTITCTASNTIGMQSVSLDINGNTVCTGKDSCSYDYTANELGDIPMFCIAVDSASTVTTTNPITVTVRPSSPTSDENGGGDIIPPEEGGVIIDINDGDIKGDIELGLVDVGFFRKIPKLAVNFIDDIKKADAPILKFFPWKLFILLLIIIVIIIISYYYKKKNDSN